MKLADSLKRRIAISTIVRLFHTELEAVYEEKIVLGTMIENRMRN